MHQGTGVGWALVGMMVAQQRILKGQRPSTGQSLLALRRALLGLAELRSISKQASTSLSGATLDRTRRMQ
jgi:hypothetical protein